MPGMVLTWSSPPECLCIAEDPEPQMVRTSPGRVRRISPAASPVRGHLSHRQFFHLQMRGQEPRTWECPSQFSLGGLLCGPQHWRASVDRLRVARG